MYDLEIFDYDHDEDKGTSERRLITRTLLPFIPQEKHAMRINEIMYVVIGIGYNIPFDDRKNIVEIRVTAMAEYDVCDPDIL
jgi:hypothetical protein